MTVTPLRAHRPNRFRWGIWGAMLVSVATCALLPLVLEGPTSFRPNQAPGGPGDGWVVVFAAVALAAALSTWVVRLLMLTRPVRRGALDPRTRMGGRRADAASIFVWGLCQSVALCGIALYLMGGEARHLYAFLSSSALLLWIHAPRQAALRRAARNLEAGRVAGKIG